LQRVSVGRFMLEAASFWAWLFSLALSGATFDNVWDNMRHLWIL